MSASPPVLTWNGSNVDMTTVARQLSSLWAEMTRGEPGGAVRTHISNLVAYASDAHVAQHITQVVGKLALQHPSRTVVVVSDRHGSGASVDAKASVSCSGLQSGTTPLCHEQVVITSHGRAADHPDSVVLPLLLAELPTYLWWPGQPPFGHRILRRLLRVAGELIVDSAEFVSPGDGLANLARIAADRGVADLNWARLGAMREVVAQFFDGAQWLPYADGIRSLQVEVGAGDGSYGIGGTISTRVTASALLLLGWMALELGWEPETTLDGLATGDIEISVMQGERVIPIQLVFRDHGAEAKGRLVRFEIVSQPKDQAPARFTFESMGNGDHARVCTAVHDGTEITRVVPLQGYDTAALLAEELDEFGRDRLFAQVAGMAARMAGRESWGM